MDQTNIDYLDDTGLDGKHKGVGYAYAYPSPGDEGAC